MASLKRLLSCVALVASISCGDPVVDESFRGQPLVTFYGESRGDSPDLELGSQAVRLGLFWSTKGILGNSIEDFYEQRQASIPIVIPQSWTLNVFDAPPNDVLVTMTGATARFAVGRLLTYKDENGNGRRDSSEPLLGLDDGRTILYAPQAIESAQSPTGVELPAGHHIVNGRLACKQVTLAQPSGERECNVPIGKECRNNSDCGEGACLREYMMPWIKGMCAVPNPTPNGCKPKNGALLKDPQEGGPVSQGGYWVQSCETSEECGRPLPYICDQGTKACMASAYIRVEIKGEVTLPNFCISTPNPKPTP